MGEVDLKRQRAKRLEEVTANDDIGCMIGGAGLLGGVLVGAVLAMAGHWCNTRSDFLCKAFSSSPPWIMLTGLATAPALLVTWYWRTTQRKRELDLRQRELEQRDRDHDIATRTRNEQDDATVESELTTFEREVLGESLVRARMIVAQAARFIARYPRQQYRALAIVATGICHHSRRGTLSDIDERLFREFTGAAMRLLGTSKRDPADAVRLNLRGARLNKLDLQGLDLSNIDFTGSILGSLKLQRTDLRDSTFAECKGRLVEIDDSTVVDDEAKAHLQALRGPEPAKAGGLSKSRRGTNA